jgi:SAM-dependent methyltransferase
MTTLETQPQLTIPIDHAKAEAFAGSLLTTLNNATLAMMLSIGHRTGLFDILADLPASTSPQIAEAANLNERYVREWLGAMVVGRVVVYDAAAQTYVLPPEHAAFLTRSAGANNIANTMQWVSVLGAVETQVIDKFHNGGGVHYCEFHRFHEVMASESDSTVVNALEPHILPLVDGLAEQLEAGIDVLEIGCGSGRASCWLAERFPNSRFIAYDLCEDALEVGAAIKKEKNLNNLTITTRDITELGHEDAFDLVLAFDVVHDQKDPAKVLDNVRGALREGATFLMVDIAASSYLEKNMDHPLGPMFYTISTMHCMTVSLAQDGEGLGTVWGEELAIKMLGEAGFNNVQVKRLDHDIMNNYYICN